LPSRTVLCNAAPILLSEKTISTSFPANPPQQAAASVSGRTLLPIVALVIVTIILDAVLSALTGEKQTFLYKEEMHLSANGVANLNLILGLPGYVQSLMGAGSDLFALFGYHRRSYYLLSALLCALGYFGLGTLHQFPYLMVVCLMLVKGAGYTLLWVVISALMVKIGNRTGTFPRLQSLAMLLPLVLNIAYLSHFGGYVTEHWSYSRAFNRAGLCALLFVPFVVLMEDPRAVRRVRTRPSAEEQAKARLERAGRAAILKQALRSPGMWAVLAFVGYLQITPYVNTAKTFYQADALHFSKQFIGDLGSYMSAGLLLAIIVYNLLGRRLSARAHIWGAYLGSAGIYVAYMGLNTAATAGAVMVAVGFCINYAYICLFACSARICPVGAEGTVYGLVLTAISSTYLVSEKFGSALYDYYGPNNKAAHYTISHGWYATLWFGLGFCLLACLFIPFLPAWTRSREPLRAMTTAQESGT
jgi:MFS family permease